MTKGARTRDAILERGLALVSVVGFKGISIGALARDVGMSKSGLYAHFNAKENLQLALLQEAIDRFVEAVVAPAFKTPRGEARVRALIEGWLDWAQNDRLPGGCIFVAATAELDDQPGALRELLVQTQRDWQETLAGAARIAIREGDFRRDLDPAQFAFELYAAALGYHFLSRLLRAPDAEQRARAAMERVLLDARDRAQGHTVATERGPTATEARPLDRARSD